MKTVIYVDGFNLYYGALKGTGYKWLDFRTLFTGMLRPSHQITAIKYFTARVTPTPDDPDVHTRQDAYFRALRAHDPTVEIIEGHYLSSTVTMKLEQPINGKKFAKVIKREEKGSDVNLAVHMLNDAWRGDSESAVVVSNDSDLAECLRLIRIRDRKFPIILCTPGCPPARRTSNQLKRWSSTALYVHGALLQNAQLPDPVVANGLSISKPLGW